jgi:hypothetical protein
VHPPDSTGFNLGIFCDFNISDKEHYYYDLPTGAWHHLLVTHNRGSADYRTLIAYWDNSKQTPDSYTNGVGSANTGEDTLILGRKCGDTNQTTNVRLSMLGIHNAIVSSAERASLYSGVQPNTLASCVHYYDLFDGGQSTNVDSEESDDLTASGCDYEDDPFRPLSGSATCSVTGTATAYDPGAISGSATSSVAGTATGSADASMSGSADCSLSMYAAPIGGKLKPIGRIHGVPFQRVDDTFVVAVPAFSKRGMTKVRFTVTPSAGSYNGTSPHDVTAITANTYTMPNGETLVCEEFCKTIDKADFTTACVATIAVELHGADGGTRDKDDNGGGWGLDDFKLRINKWGLMPQYRAWVHTDGNDTTGTVEDDTKPYATIEKAAEDLIAYMNTMGYGSVGDGCRILLGAGTHDSAAGDTDYLTCDDEWMFIEPEDGVTQAQAKIGVPVSGNSKHIGKLCFKGITLEGQNCYKYTAGSPYMWVQDCLVDGEDEADGPFTTSPRGTRYWTDVTITDIGYVIRSDQYGKAVPLVSGVVVTDLTNDLAPECTCIINAILDMTGSLAQHADMISFNTSQPRANVLFYNARGLGFEQSQGIFMAAGTSVVGGVGYDDGIAIVNVIGRDNPLDTGMWKACNFKRPIHHLIMRDTTWHADVATAEELWSEYDDPSWYGVVRFAAQSLQGNSLAWNVISEVDIQGVFMRALVVDPMQHGVLLSHDGWAHIHLGAVTGIYQVVNPDWITDLTTGNEGSQITAVGYPLYDCDLRTRVTDPATEYDLAGRLRQATTDIGANEFHTIMPLRRRMYSRNGRLL